MPEIASNSHDETAALGVKLASFVFACGGAVIALNGTLGSGKTCLTKGIAKGLGLTDNITSPTYTIINEYPLSSGKILYHIDAYRLNSLKDFEDIGGIEIINSDNISVIEWSERISVAVPADAITITLKVTGSDSRLIKIDGLKGELNFE
jgi:tRNA threonylcarbamoyladenosine biosynthesis protein TsaE